MKLNCMIDSVQYELNVNPDKPLSRILEERIESFSISNSCHKSKCGNCIVLLDGVCSLSCLVPAFQLADSTILTYEGFSKTKLCSDIEKAYAETGNCPCNQCYASKTLLIESMIEMLDQSKKTGHTIVGRKIIKTIQTVDAEFIEKELSINSCKCMETSQVEKIVKLAYIYRSKRRAQQ